MNSCGPVEAEIARLYDNWRLPTLSEMEEAYSKPDSILEKLRTFHHAHQTALDVLQADLEAAVEQLPDKTCHHEAEIVADVLEQQARRRRGPAPLGELLPAILARLNMRIKAADRNGDRS